MLVLIVVLPCLLVGAAAVIVLDRMGVLAGPRASGPSDGPLLERVPKGALMGAIALMAVWILVWLVVLVVGLNVLAS